MSTREKFTLRHYLPEDYPALAEVANAVHVRLGDEPSLTAELLSRYFDTPDFNRTTNSFILEMGGRIAGMTDQEFSASSGRCWVDSAVHPDFWGQGIGAELIRLTEVRCLEWAEMAVAPDQPVSIQRYTVDYNPRAVRLFEAQGYQHIRTFYRMRMALDQPMEAPPLPNGLVLRPFDPQQHAEAVYEAQMDSFADHWGFERDSYEEWVAQVLNNPSNEDFALWLVAYDGDQIAGVCLNWRSDAETAWTARLGVRPEWRRRGLGEALLRTSFARFQQAGFQRAELAVDAASLTNAVALYERAGMHVHKRTLVYSKILRDKFLRGEVPEGS